MKQHALTLHTLDVGIDVHVSDPHIHRLLARAFSALLTPSGQTRPADLTYRVQGALPDAVVMREDQTVASAADDYDLLYGFEKDLTLQLQYRRPDLLFLHAAALGWNRRGVLITAPSGTGKSTTTWGLLHHEFEYLSDELAPIDLDAMTVLPYPHALCLKATPPPPHPLPPDVLTTAWTRHVAPESVPGATVTEPMPVTTVMVLTRPPDNAQPAISPISSAAAAAQLYGNGLNLLAHGNQGLDAVVRVARHCRCYHLTGGELEATCRLIADTMRSEAEGGSRPTSHI